MKKFILIAAALFVFNGATMMAQASDTKSTPQTACTSADCLNKEANISLTGDAKKHGKKGDAKKHNKKGDTKAHGKKGGHRKGWQKPGDNVTYPARKGNGKFGNFYALRGLNLSEAQLAKIKTLQEKQSEEIEKIREATFKEREKIRKATAKKMEKINKSTDEQLSKILTPAQYAQYKSQLESQQRKKAAIQSKRGRKDKPCNHNDSCYARRDTHPKATF